MGDHLGPVKLRAVGKYRGGNLQVRAHSGLTTGGLGVIFILIIGTHMSLMSNIVVMPRSSLPTPDVMPRPCLLLSYLTRFSTSYYCLVTIW